VSGLIPREFINELINRTDIIELIDARVPLKKAGHNHQACCPFHTEKTPSFTVSSTKQFYYCFGCGASGNVIGFLMAYDRLEFIDAVELLAKQLGLEIPTEKTKDKSFTQDLYQPLEKTSQYYQKQLRQSPDAIQYLKNRGLSGEIAKCFRLGYAPNSSQDPFRNRIIFPIHDRRGRVIGFGGRVLDDRLPKYLNSPDSPIFHKSNVLYGLYEARQANRELKQLIVVEGYMDVVSLFQSGITFAVATLGTATTVQHVTQLFQHANQIIFCFDGDNAGRKAAWRALESTLQALRDDVEARFLFLPEGEDPDSLIKKEGKEEFLSRLSNAQSLGDFFFSQLKGQVNLRSLEGRAQFAKLALPYIENIPAPILREMMLNQLSTIIHLDKSELNQFISNAILSKTSVKIERTPLRLAVAMLLQKPSLIKKIVLKKFGYDEPLQEIINLLQQNSELMTGHLLEYFRDRSESAFLYKLSAWDHGVPEEGMISEFQDILNHLQKLDKDKEIEKLLQKANSGLLSEEERIQLQEMLGKR
jgi:DNA primase